MRIKERESESKYENWSCIVCQIELLQSTIIEPNRLVCNFRPYQCDYRSGQSFLFRCLSIGEFRMNRRRKEWLRLTIVWWISLSNRNDDAHTNTPVSRAMTSIDFFIILRQLVWIASWVVRLDWFIWMDPHLTSRLWSNIELVQKYENYLNGKRSERYIPNEMPKLTDANENK